MAVKIDKKIKGYSVLTPEDKAREAAAPVPTASVARETVEKETPQDNIIQMHERIERPEVLIGSTYKIKSPLVEHAMYVTINDIVLNAGTEHELRRPFEIFVNSKSMEHFQWIVALTRIMSAVFRKGGDVTFLVDEMKAVFDKLREVRGLVDDGFTGRDWAVATGMVSSGEAAKRSPLAMARLAAYTSPPGCQVCSWRCSPSRSASTAAAARCARAGLASYTVSSTRVPNT